MRGYHILQVRPQGYIHAEALTELTLSCYFGLQRLGETVSRDMEPPAGRAIVFGAHLLNQSSTLPANAIVYNTEQILPGSPWIRSAYLDRLRNHVVWDYSERNALRLRELGVPDVRHVPVGYVPELVRIQPVVEDIDVLFYGSLNERRLYVLDQLKRRGLNVVDLFGVYGQTRDRMIARAKIVLNVHFYESKIFEIVRVSYLLSNSKAVVCECGSETEIDVHLRDAVYCADYAKLSDACVVLLQDEGMRHALALRGHEIFSNCRSEDSLAKALGLPPPQHPRDSIAHSV